MKGLFNILLGFIIIGTIGYTIFHLTMMVFDKSDKTIDDLGFPLVITLFFIVFFIYGFYQERKENKKKSKAKTTSHPIEKERVYNPEIDKLLFTTYQQESKTWWSDSDGDSHTRETEYASLRFYEDGTVIGKRDIAILKLESEDSYVYKGSWELNDNNIQIKLEKVKEVDDSVNLYISPEEKRDMKYAGHVTHDDDLIKAGFYTGTIISDTIKIGKMIFREKKPSRLIITASESSCNALAAEFKDHPLVFGASTNSGNWYSNGETGPEWFTVTFEGNYDLREQLEKDIKESSTDYSNMFWG